MVEFRFSCSIKTNSWVALHGSNLEDKFYFMGKFYVYITKLTLLIFLYFFIDLFTKTVHAAALFSAFN